MEVNKMVVCSVMHMYNFLGSDGSMCVLTWCIAVDWERV